MKYGKGIKKVLVLLVFFSLFLGSVVPLTYAEEITELSSESLNIEAFETETESETSIETETESETVTETETESETVIETETESETVIETETESETVTGTETESETVIETETESETVSEIETESETASETETESETASETETESEADSETETESETSEEEISTYVASLEASGKTVVGAPGWTQATNINRVSPSFYPVRFYSGISSIEVFGDTSKVNVVSLDTDFQFYPLSTDAEGKFGVIYRKVLYYNYQWYDLRMTVAAYSSQVRCDGGDTVKMFPFMEFSKSTIGFHFHEAVGEYVLKCEFVNSQTGAVEKTDVRFQWNDIDAAQRFGLRLSDGNIAARYYYGDSRLYYQTGQRIAGVAGMEMVVGPSDNSESLDLKNAAVYELQQCSTYYMAIGFRDHMTNDGNSLTKKSLTTWRKQLEAGTFTGNKSWLFQSDTGMNIIRTPEPVKQVANIGEGWSTQNTLPEARSEYCYRITQFVPWQSTSAYYDTFLIEDSLPAGVEYVGNIQIIRREDQKDVTGWFDVSAKSNVVTASVKSATLKAAGFYGYHYDITFRVKLNPEKAPCIFEGNRADFSVTNQALLKIKHARESNSQETGSNSVQTKASLERQLQADPVKGFGNTETQREKILYNEDDEIIFGIFQKIPKNDSFFQPAFIEMKDTLESCLMYQNVTIKYRAAGSQEWADVNGWSVTAEGQNIRVKGNCLKEYEGGTLLWQIRCRIQKGMDLSRWKKTAAGREWTEISNRASVTFTWDRGIPQSITKETNPVVVKLQKMLIRLVKEIDGQDIVWAHGNPTFTFRVEGTDLNGKYHVWNQTVEFLENNTQNSGKVMKTAQFEVPAGVYVASELPVIRYRLNGIHSIAGGIQDEDRVLFDLSTQPEGSAVFYNEKITDEDESDTFFVKNQIGS